MKVIETMKIELTKEELEKMWLSTNETLESWGEETISFEDFKESFFHYNYDEVRETLLDFRADRIIDFENDRTVKFIAK